jgi:RimJ/RimL family protein N-acetyltransferase
MSEVVLRECVLRDGTPAVVLPARREDRELLRSSYESLSPESQFHRFLTAVPHLTDAMLDRLVDGVDWVDHVALVLAVQRPDGPPEKVAIARLIRYEEHPSDADVAVTVLDEWQGLGIASVLLDELVRMRPLGIDRLVTEVADDNPAALAMLERLGRSTATSTERGSFEVVVELS